MGSQPSSSLLNTNLYSFMGRNMHEAAHERSFLPSSQRFARATQHCCVKGETSDKDRWSSQVLSLSLLSWFLSPSLSILLLNYRSQSTSFDPSEFEHGSSSGFIREALGGYKMEGIRKTVLFIKYLEKKKDRKKYSI
jgi:hypothetical protein